ncbi:MAG TPA: hypothetical protein VF979_12620, partial [Streptosporangiaceae bacterium]
MSAPNQRPDVAGLVSAARPRLVRPGLLPADPRLERYLVHPGAVTALELDAGDKITVVDVEGRQRGELTMLAGGAEDYRAAGTSADGAATVLRALAGAGPAVTGAGQAASGAGPAVGSGADAIAALAARGLDPVTARAVRLFGEWSPAGASACFTAQRPVTCIVAAPCALMPVDADNPPSDLLIEVQRTQPRQRRQPNLPPPLADLVLDLRIDSSTARAFEVEAG